MMMVALAVVVVSQEARAGDTAERQAIQALSRARGVDQRRITRLFESCS